VDHVQQRSVSSIPENILIEVPLDGTTVGYPELVKRYDGWRNYALLMQAALKRVGVESPVTITSSGASDLRNIARASLQEHRDSPSAPLNYLLIVTLEPSYDQAAEIASTPEHPAKPSPAPSGT